MTKGALTQKHLKKWKEQKKAHLITLPGGVKSNTANKRFCYKESIKMYATARCVVATGTTDFRSSSNSELPDPIMNTLSFLSESMARSRYCLLGINDARQIFSSSILINMT